MTAYELYRHEAQGDKDRGEKGIRGLSLEKHLRESGLLARTFSYESEIVQGWLDHPETYPDEFRHCVYPVLWGDAYDGYDLPFHYYYRKVPFLFWHSHEGRVSVGVGTQRLDGDFWQHMPALLKPIG